MLETPESRAAKDTIVSPYNLTRERETPYLVKVTFRIEMWVQPTNVRVWGGRIGWVVLPKKVLPLHLLCSPQSVELQFDEGHANHPFPSIVPLDPLIVIFVALTALISGLSWSAVPMCGRNPVTP